MAIGVPRIINLEQRGSVRAAKAKDKYES